MLEGAGEAERLLSFIRSSCSDPQRQSWLSWVTEFYEKLCQLGPNLGLGGSHQTYFEGPLTQIGATLLEYLRQWPVGGPVAHLLPAIQSELRRALNCEDALLVLIPASSSNDFFSRDSFWSWQDSIRAVLAEACDVEWLGWYRIQKGQGMVATDTGEEVAQVPHCPLLCECLYPWHARDDILRWPLAYHEIGHHVVFAVCKAEMSDDGSGQALDPVRNQLLAEFSKHPLVTKWKVEVFADRVAVRLMGPAYVEALKIAESKGAGTESTETHPSLTLRRLIQRAILEQSDAEELDEARSDTRSFTPREEQFLQDSLHNYIPELDEALDAVGLAPRTRTPSCEKIDELCQQLLDYVPPVGKPKIVRDQQHQTATCSVPEPASVSEVLSAVVALRLDKERWKQFCRPWNGDEQEAEKRLAKLAIKALSVVSFV